MSASAIMKVRKHMGFALVGELGAKQSSGARERRHEARTEQPARSHNDVTVWTTTAPTGTKMIQQGCNGCALQ